MIIHCGRKISSKELMQICETVKTFSRLSRNELVHTVCEHLGWYTASGRNKFEACLKLLQRLEAEDFIQLPEKGKGKRGPKNPKELIPTDRTRPQKELDGKLSDIGPVFLRIAQTKDEVSLVNEYLHRYHYLGYKKTIWVSSTLSYQGPRFNLGLHVVWWGRQGLETARSMDRLEC